MKLYKYGWLAVLPMIFTACQDDTLVENQQQGKIYSLSATMDGGAAMSRAQIQTGNLDETREIFFWNGGDSFDMYQKSGDSYQRSVFEIASDYTASSAEAVFTTQTPVEATGYNAIYPSGLSVEDNAVKCEIKNRNTLDFTSKTESEVWTEYFNKNMYLMTGAGTLTSEGTNTIEFKHLTSLIRITYTNETSDAQVVKGVALGGNQHFRLWNMYNIENGTLIEEGGTTNDYITYMNGLSVDPNASVDLYVLLFPSNFDSGEMHINIIGESGNYKSAKMPTSVLKENLGIDGFKASQRYWFKITETSDNGMVWSKDFGKVIIPNVELSNALYDKYQQYVEYINYNGYAVMDQADVVNIPELDFEWKDYEIKSLDGIEYFQYLEKLNCANNQLTSCDVSQNTLLTVINVQSNQLTSLDLSNNPLLTTVICSYNEKLTSLDLENCSQIGNLQIQNTGLVTLEIPNKEGLNNFLYGYTSLSIDLNDFPGLTGLGCEGKLIGDDPLSNIPENLKNKLVALFCGDNGLTNINLEEYPCLQYLQCNDGALTSLDLSKAPQLVELQCYHNDIKTLDITSLNNLQTLICGGQNIEGNMILTLTEKQYDVWESNWFENAGGLNGNVDTSIYYPDVDFANESTADGSEQQPYEIANAEHLYSFMLRCYNEKSDENGELYRNLCYKLTSDIELNGSVSWRDFYFNGVFDGDGHTISGNRENTMFGFLLGNAIIRNLKLNVNVTSNESGYTNFGPLARTVDGGLVINCVNMADFSVSNPYAGGLVGAMFSGAKMIGCANTGDILANSNIIGGLVAELYSGATIECSYSTGKIQYSGDFYVEGDEYHFGGLAGMINVSPTGEWGLATMSGCWTNTTIEAAEDKKTDIVFNGKEETALFSCYKVESVPSSDQINNMNSSLTNTVYMFGTDGTIVPASGNKPSTSLPEIEVEDF